MKDAGGIVVAGPNTGSRTGSLILLILRDYFSLVQFLMAGINISR